VGEPLDLLRDQLISHKRIIRVNERSRALDKDAAYAAITQEAAEKARPPVKGYRRVSAMSLHYGAGATGLEPATSRFEVWRSIQLIYAPEWRYAQSVWNLRNEISSILGKPAQRY
jgi:hypothetical protein